MFGHKNLLYPMLFEPNLHRVVWGGDKITAGAKGVE